MAYINTKSCGSIQSSQVLSVGVSPYTRLINLLIVKNELIGLFSSESPDIWDTSKIFNFRLIRGLLQSGNYVDNNFNFFDTIKVIDDETIEFYHIFVQEIKTIDEQRNEKIDNFINQEF